MRFKDENFSFWYVTLSVILSFVIFFLLAGKPSLLALAGAAGGTSVIFLISIIIPLILYASGVQYAKISFSIIILALSLISAAGQSGYSLSPGPQNFEQCAIELMKDQPSNMAPVVARECRRQFPQE